MRRATAYTLASAVLWGTTFPTITYGLTEGEAGPLTFVFLRFLLAVAAFGVLLLALGRLQFDSLRHPAVWGLGALHALGYAMQFVAQDQTTASKTSLLVDINVVAVALLAYFFLKEPFTRRLVAALFFGGAGVVFLATQGDLEAARFSRPEFVGDVLALGAGAVWAFYFVGLKKWLDHRPQMGGLSLTFGILLATTAFLAPVAFFGEGADQVGNAKAWAMIVYLALFATALSTYLWQEALREQSATVSAVLLLLEIVVALVISYFWLEERINAWGAAGAGLILLASYLASTATPPERPAPLPQAPA